MEKFFLGIATVLLVIVVAVGCLWLFDLVGVIKMNDLILNEAGKLTGMKKLAVNYELGKKRSAVLQKKEMELTTKERQLAARETKLQKNFTELEDQKQLWLKEHSQTVQAIQTNGITGAKASPASDRSVKNYLATIGAMKVDKAAAVMQKLPDETVLLIFDQLRTNQAAKLMESLPAEYLTRLTKARLNPNVALPVKAVKQGI
jgi:flagellar motility protein MotE (MotC chaperone)